MTPEEKELKKIPGLNQGNEGGIRRCTKLTENGVDAHVNMLCRGLSFASTSSKQWIEVEEDLRSVMIYCR